MVILLHTVLNRDYSIIFSNKLISPLFESYPFRDVEVLFVLRTSMSRAYYAAFLKSKIKLESLGYSFPDDSRIHFDVKECLRNKLKKSNIAFKL